MRILWIVIILFVGLNANTQGGETILQAQEDYQSGDYQSALKGYLELEASNSSWITYYNIGNCYYQLDSTAKAVLYFEKAVKRNPRSRKARENLEIAKSRIPERVVSIREFFLVKWMKGASMLLPLYLWGVLLLTLLVSLVYYWAQAIRSANMRRYQNRFIALIIAILLATGPALYARYEYFSEHKGVVMSSAGVHMAPDETSAISKSINAGETVQILEEFDGFLKVRFVNYEVGWLSEGIVERI